jgi:hypothetical protein
MNYHFEQVKNDVWGVAGQDLLDRFTHMSDAELMLDKDFWSALGKARGWGVSNSVLYDEGEVYTSGYLYHWHRFLDHLAGGKDAESFFADLGTSSNN